MSTTDSADNQPKAAGESPKGTLSYIDSTITPVMGQYVVYVKAQCAPATEEWLTQTPTCTLYVNNNQLGTPVDMQLIAGETDKWECTFYGVYPRPDALKLEAKFMDSTMQLTTVSDVVPIGSNLIPIPDPDPCNFRPTWRKAKNKVIVKATGITGTMMKGFKPLVGFHLPGQSTPFTTKDLLPIETPPQSGFENTFDEAHESHCMRVTICFAPAEKWTRIITKTAEEVKTP